MSTPPSSARPVTGSASIQVLGRVAGARRAAWVLRADPDTVLVDLDGFCLAILAEGAVQLPCGVRTPLETLPETHVGDQVVVADGTVVLPRFEVLVTHIVDNTAPVVGLPAAAWGAAHLEAVAGDRLRRLRADLPTAAADLLRAADPRAVETLVGAGPSGTRLGDDALSGWLAAGVATRHPALPRVRTATILAIRESADLLSATLLGCAARGETVPEFRDLLAAVGARDAAAVEEPLDVLLSRPTSGGAGLVVGAVQALAGLADRARAQNHLASAG